MYLTIFSFREVKERLQVDISVRSTAQGLVDAFGRKHDVAYCRVCFPLFFFCFFLRSFSSFSLLGSAISILAGFSLASGEEKEIFGPFLRDYFF